MTAAVKSKLLALATKMAKVVDTYDGGADDGTSWMFRYTTPSGVTVNGRPAILVMDGYPYKSSETGLSADDVPEGFNSEQVQYEGRLIKFAWADANQVTSEGIAKGLGDCFNGAPDTASCKLFMPWNDQQLPYALGADVAFGEAKFPYVRRNKRLSSTMQSVSVAVGPSGCGARLDLAFLLDGSGSVDKEGWKAQLDFVETLGSKLKVAPELTRISITTYAGPRVSHFSIDGEDVNTIQTSTPCSADAECHRVGQPGVEKCVDNKCVEQVPQHCPLGTAYEALQTTAGVVSEDTVRKSLGCICAGKSKVEPDRQMVPCKTGSPICNPQEPSSTECTSGGCKEAYYSLNAGGCGAIGSTVVTGEIDLSAFPDCSRRNYFSLACGLTGQCNCASPGYVWEEDHSAWVTTHFDDDNTLAELQAVLADGSEEDCPPVGWETGYSHDNWAGRPKSCFPNGASHLAIGFKTVATEVFKVARGMRPRQDGVPRTLFVLTDGKSNPHFSSSDWAKYVREQNIIVYAIGMGEATAGGTYWTELNDIATEPRQMHVFTVDDPTDVTELVEQLSQEVCELDDPIWFIEIETPVDTGTSQFYDFVCKDADGEVVVVVTQVRGGVRVYVSTVRNPGPYDTRAKDETADAEGASNRKVVILDANGASPVYATVTATAADSVYKIAVFRAPPQERASITVVLPIDDLAPGVLHTPVEAPGGRWTYELVDDSGHFEVDANTGVLSLTLAGATAVKSGTIVAEVVGYIPLAKEDREFTDEELAAAGCNVYQQVRVRSSAEVIFTTPERCPGVFTLEEHVAGEYERDPTQSPGTQPTEDLLVVQTVATAGSMAAGSIDYTAIPDGSTPGAFSVSLDGHVRVSDPTKFKAGVSVTQVVQATDSCDSCTTVPTPAMCTISVTPTPVRIAPGWGGDQFKHLECFKEYAENTLLWEIPVTNPSKLDFGCQIDNDDTFIYTEPGTSSSGASSCKVMVEGGRQIAGGMTYKISLTVGDSDTLVPSTAPSTEEGFAALQLWACSGVQTTTNPLTAIDVEMYYAMPADSPVARPEAPTGATACAIVADDPISSPSLSAVLRDGKCDVTTAERVMERPTDDRRRSTHGYEMSYTLADNSRVPGPVVTATLVFGCPPVCGAAGFVEGKACVRTRNDFRCTEDEPDIDYCNALGGNPCASTADFGAPSRGRCVANTAYKTGGSAYECDCPDGYSQVGFSTTQPTNPVCEAPCPASLCNDPDQTLGACTVKQDAGVYVCDCPFPFYGAKCENTYLGADPCDRKPCGANGMCRRTKPCSADAPADPWGSDYVCDCCCDGDCSNGVGVDGTFGVGYVKDVAAGIVYQGRPACDPNAIGPHQCAGRGDCGITISCSQSTFFCAASPAEVCADEAAEYGTAKLAEPTCGGIGGGPPITIGESKASSGMDGGIIAVIILIILVLIAAIVFFAWKRQRDRDVMKEVAAARGGSFAAPAARAPAITNAVYDGLPAQGMARGASVTNATYAGVGGDASLPAGVGNPMYGQGQARGDEGTYATGIPSALSAPDTGTAGGYLQVGDVDGPAGMSNPMYGAQTSDGTTYAIPVDGAAPEGSYADLPAINAGAEYGDAATAPNPAYAAAADQQGGAEYGDASAPSSSVYAAAAGNTGAAYGDAASASSPAYDTARAVTDSPAYDTAGAGTTPVATYALAQQPAGSTSTYDTAA